LFRHSIICTFAICLILFNGCAAIFNGENQEVYIQSQPPLATGYLLGRTFVTPGTVKLPRKEDHVIVLKKEGYKDATVTVKSEMNVELLVIDIFLWGVFGLIDLSGGCYELSPSSTIVMLESEIGAYIDKSASSPLAIHLDRHESLELFDVKPSAGKPTFSEEMAIQILYDEAARSGLTQDFESVEISILEWTFSEGMFYAKVKILATNQVEDGSAREKIGDVFFRMDGATWKVHDYKAGATSALHVDNASQHGTGVVSKGQVAVSRSEVSASSRQAQAPTPLPTREVVDLASSADDQSQPTGLLRKHFIALIGDEALSANLDCDAVRVEILSMDTRGMEYVASVRVTAAKGTASSMKEMNIVLTKRSEGWEVSADK